MHGLLNLNRREEVQRIFGGLDWYVSESVQIIFKRLNWYISKFVQQIFERYDLHVSKSFPRIFKRMEWFQRIHSKNFREFELIYQWIRSKNIRKILPVSQRIHPKNLWRLKSCQRIHSKHFQMITLTYQRIHYSFLHRCVACWLKSNSLIIFPSEYILFWEFVFCGLVYLIFFCLVVLYYSFLQALVCCQQYPISWSGSKSFPVIIWLIWNLLTNSKSNI